MMGAIVQVCDPNSLEMVEARRSAGSRVLVHGQPGLLVTMDVGDGWRKKK